MLRYTYQLLHAIMSKLTLFIDVVMDYTAHLQDRVIVRGIRDHKLGIRITRFGITHQNIDIYSGIEDQPFRLIIRKKQQQQQN